MSYSTTKNQTITAIFEPYRSTCTIETSYSSLAFNNAYTGYEFSWDKSLHPELITVDVNYFNPKTGAYTIYCKKIGSVQKQIKITFTITITYSLDDTYFINNKPLSDLDMVAKVDATAVDVFGNSGLEYAREQFMINGNDDIIFNNVYIASKPWQATNCIKLDYFYKDDRATTDDLTQLCIAKKDCMIKPLRIEKIANDTDYELSTNNKAKVIYTTYNNKSTSESMTIKIQRIFSSSILTEDHIRILKNGVLTYLATKSTVLIDGITYSADPVFADVGYIPTCLGILLCAGGGGGSGGCRHTYDYDNSDICFGGVGGGGGASAIGVLDFKKSKIFYINLGYYGVASSATFKRIQYTDEESAVLNTIELLRGHDGGDTTIIDSSNNTILTLEGGKGGYFKLDQNNWQDYAIIPTTETANFDIYDNYKQYFTAVTGARGGIGAKTPHSKIQVVLEPGADGTVRPIINFDMANSTVATATINAAAGGSGAVTEGAKSGCWPGGGGASLGIGGTFYTGEEADRCGYVGGGGCGTVNCDSQISDFPGTGGRGWCLLFY